MTVTKTSESNYREELPFVTPSERSRLLQEMLKKVSRGFYLTLRVLPITLREPMGVAYMLARVADSIADTRLINPDERLNNLLKFRTQMEGHPLDIQALHEISCSIVEKRGPIEEGFLLTSLTQLFSLLDALPKEDRDRVRTIVIMLTRGMEFDLTFFSHDDSGQVSAIKDWEQLDGYMYHVAGCVGEFWTDMTMAHTNSMLISEIERLSELGVRCGKALQLTNILRDIPKDVRLGRCYLPSSELARVGLEPKDLLDATFSSQARPMLLRGVNLALEHYTYAEQYLFAISRKSPRLRLAVLWPIVMGLGTLAELARKENWLENGRPSKVSRPWVYRMLVRSVPCSFSNFALGAWIGALRERVQKLLY